MVDPIQVNVGNMKVGEKNMQFLGGKIVMGESFSPAVLGDESIRFDLLEFFSLVFQFGNGDENEPFPFQDPFDFFDDLLNGGDPGMMNHLDGKEGIEKFVLIR